MDNLRVFARHVHKGDHFLHPGPGLIQGREVIARANAGVLPWGWRPMAPIDTVIQYEEIGGRTGGNLVLSQTDELDVVERAGRRYESVDLSLLGTHGMPVPSAAELYGMLHMLNARLARLEQHLGINGP